MRASRRTLDSSDVVSFFISKLDRDGNFVWANKEQGATVLLQRIVIGLEAKIPVSASIELMCQGRLTKGIIDQLNDPFSLGSKSTADCYYNRVPSLVGRKFALKMANPVLWELVRTFYRDIRNKIFHGHFVNGLTAEKLDYIFSVFDQVYAWSDTWGNVIERMNEIGAGMHGRPIAPKTSSEESPC